MTYSTHHEAPRNTLLSNSLILHPPTSKRHPQRPGLTHDHLTYTNKETGKAEVNLTKPMVSCTQHLNVYRYFQFCDTVLSTGCVSYQYSATHCLHLLP